MSPSVSSVGDRTAQNFQAMKLPLPTLSGPSTKESGHYNHEDQDQKEFEGYCEEDETNIKYEDEYLEEEMPGGYEDGSDQAYQYDEMSKEEYEDHGDEEQYDEDGYLLQPGESDQDGDAAHTNTRSLWSDESISLSDQTFNKGFIAVTPPRNVQRPAPREQQQQGDYYLFFQCMPS